MDKREPLPNPVAVEGPKPADLTPSPTDAKVEFQSKPPTAAAAPVKVELPVEPPSPAPSPTKAPIKPTLVDEGEAERIEEIADSARTVDQYREASDAFNQEAQK